MSIRFGGGGAQQDIDGDGGRYRVRSCADASGRAVRALWRAPRSVLGCAAVCGGGQDEFHCGGQVRPPAGVDDVRMGACSGSAPSTRRPVADRQHAEGPRLSAGDEPPASKGPLGDADRGQVEEAPK